MDDFIWIDPQWAWAQICAILIALGVGGFMTFVIKSFSNLKKKIDGFINMQDTQSEAIRNIIKTLIVIIHDKATEDKYIGRYKLEVSERLFDSYKKLNGNTYVADLMSDIRELPHGKRNKE